MAAIEIEERFTVNAPVERVWRHLLDPEQIVVCLPGAELLEVEGERTFHGQMKVKVGPVTVAYKGQIDLTEVDEAGRRIQMVGKGKEKGGTGTAKMTMDSRVIPLDQGGCEVMVHSDVELAGRIARFGRGMIQSVAGQLFKQFANNVRETLESAAPASESAPEPQSESAKESESAPESEIDTRSGADRESETGGESETAPETEAEDGAEEEAIDEAPRREIEQRGAEPVRALPLLLRALWDMVTGVLRKLTGRKGSSRR